MANYTNEQKSIILSDPSFDDKARAVLRKRGSYNKIDWTTEKIEHWRAFGYDNLPLLIEQLQIKKMRAALAPDVIKAILNRDINSAHTRILEDIEKVGRNIQLLNNWFACLNVFQEKELVIEGVQFYEGHYTFPSLGLTAPKPLSEIAFCSLLVDIAKIALVKTEYASFIEGLPIQKIEEASLQLKRVKARDLIKAEESYSNLVRTWINDQIEFSDALIKARGQIVGPKTLIANIDMKSLKVVYKNMIEKRWIKPMSEDDFIYLLQGNPIRDKMPIIKPLDKFTKQKIYYFIKVVLGINPIDYLCANNCIKTATKLTNKDINKRKYAEIDDLLK